MKPGIWKFPALLAIAAAMGAGGVFALTVAGTAQPSDVLVGDWAFVPDRCDEDSVRMHFANGNITMRRGSVVREFGHDYQVVEEGGLLKLEFTHSESQKTIIWHFKSAMPGTLQLTLEGMTDHVTEEQRAKAAQMSFIRCA